MIRSTALALFIVLVGLSVIESIPNRSVQSAAEAKAPAQPLDLATLSPHAQAVVSATLARDDTSYRASVDGSGIRANNPHHALETLFTTDGLTVSHGADRLRLRL